MVFLQEAVIDNYITYKIISTLVKGPKQAVDKWGILTFISRNRARDVRAKGLRVG